MYSLLLVVQADILRVAVTKSGHLSINYFLHRNYQILFVGPDFRSAQYSSIYTVQYR